MDEPGDTLTYAWSFSDGTTATGAVVERTFAEPGDVTATATATDTTKRSASSSAIVRITPADPGPSVPAGPPAPPADETPGGDAVPSAGRPGGGPRVPKGGLRHAAEAAEAPARRDRGAAALRRGMLGPSSRCAPRAGGRRVWERAA
jgi:hypothetical protein